MSVFDFPRINFQGVIQLNPGTANNDDYAGALFVPDGPAAGQTLGLIDSRLVQARTFARRDADFVDWAQRPQPFLNSRRETVQQVPAEWNYFGVMDAQILDAKVLGVQTAPDQLYTRPDSNVPLSALIGQPVAYEGTFTDNNSEGSPPATQFFIDKFSVGENGGPQISGAASKGTGQWLGFFRNANLTQDAGSGAYVYHTLTRGAGNTVRLGEPWDDAIVGVILRYYLYRALGDGENPNDPDYYKGGKTHPKKLEIAGSITPLFASERITTAPTGRLLVSGETNIKTPTGNNNGGGLLALNPTVAHQQGGILSVDFLATFPDNYQEGASNAEGVREKAEATGSGSFRALATAGSQDGPNPKLDFGPVFLEVTDGLQTETIAQVDYAKTLEGNQRGWLFDFPLTDAARTLLRDGDAILRLSSENFGAVAEETDFYFVSNQLAVYGEQWGSETHFLNQGTEEAITLSVFHRGRELDAASCPPISVWSYRSIPLQGPGSATLLTDGLKPGQPISLDVSQPGNHLLTFTAGDDPSPPCDYATFAYPPALAVTNLPSISVRILPNVEDFSKYYVDPTDPEPVGNDALTFEVVYWKVLRTYFLLYPGMSEVFPLNNPDAVKANAQAILDRTELSIWLTSGYMPRTRDLSHSRRALLRAWCHKVLGA